MQLTLGRLCIANSLVDDAIGHLKKSIEISPRVEACVELGRLSEQQDDPESALSYYREALEIEGISQES